MRIKDFFFFFFFETAEKSHITYTYGIFLEKIRRKSYD